ncbi:YhgE/Pip domain-containing protein [Bifidobacterium miconisargentati]|uniref:YhgE/Pip domain-containing protein n=1 Tax=Bifidobacterium miconisargentati TaxID=2834437 RepID=UPI001BDC543D|nr:YhgE/Pip domain-containing protein [Bifidobacterium miconisargentati]MBW3090565.1 YhgE/Pip domain-containing protein [Bifidobacterium miconisargentati]
MRNVWKVFARDARRVLAVPFAVLLLVASCVIPGLYSWLNVAANLDPYALTGNVPIAVANNDRGTSVNGKDMNFGDQTIAELKKNHDLGWRFTDENTAIDGVESGDYYAAIIIPKDFSADMTSVLQGTVIRPRLDFYVNEKANSLSPRVAESGAEALEKQINESFVTTVSATVTRGLAKEAGTANDKLDGTADTLDGKLAEAQQSIADARTGITDAQASIDSSRRTIAQVRQDMTALACRADALAGSIDGTASDISAARGGLAAFGQSANGAIGQAQTGLGTLSSHAGNAIGSINGSAADLSGRVDGMLATLESANDRLGDAIDAMESDPELAQSQALRQAKEYQQAIEAQITTLQGINNELPGSLQASGDKITSSLDSLTKKTEDLSRLSGEATSKASRGLDIVSTSLTGLSGAVGGAAQELKGMDSDLTQLDATLESTATVMKQTDDQLGRVYESVNRTRNDFAVLRAGEAWARLKGLSGVDADSVSEFLASPVELDSCDYYPVKNYGSAVAPFFTSVGCWVGSFVALTLFRQDADSDGIEGLTAPQAFLGRWLLMMPLAMLQGVVISVGNLLIGIQCVAPAAYIFATMVCSMTYVSLVYNLVMLFRHIGMALSVIILILQVPGAGGMYPIEMMPRFYRLLNPVLPFTYGVQALREPIGGFYDNDYWTDLGRTALFAVAFLLVAVACRPALANLNDLFTRELADTDLVNVRKVEMVGADRNVMRTVRKMMNDPTWGVGVRRRAASFERWYPYAKRIGFHLIWAIPVAFLAVMMVTGPRIGFLVAWLIAVLTIDVALIVAEYLHLNLPRQAEETRMDMRELMQTMQTKLGKAIR